MDRRKFIKGTVAAAVAAAIPVGDGVALYSAAHPELEVLDYRHVGYKIIYKGVKSNYGEVGEKMAKALARSMRQTLEQTAANVLSSAFELKPITIEEMYLNV